MEKKIPIIPLEIREKLGWELKGKRICKCCFEEFKPNGKKNKVFCESCRNNKRLRQYYYSIKRNNREWNKKKYEEEIKNHNLLKICKCCFEEFKPEKKNYIFCESCRNNKPLTRYYYKSIEKRIHWTINEYENHIKLQNNDLSRICKCCFEEFKPKTRQDHVLCESCRNNEKLSSSYFSSKRFNNVWNKERYKDQIKILNNELLKICKCCFEEFKPKLVTTQRCYKCIDDRAIEYEYYKSIKKGIPWTIDKYKKYKQYERHKKIRPKFKCKYPSSTIEYKNEYSTFFRKIYLTPPIKHVILSKIHVYESKSLRKMYEEFNDGINICYTCEAPIGASWIEFVNFGSEFLFNKKLKKWEPYCYRCVTRKKKEKML